MILSMTGYGKAEHNFRNKNISIELRALNSKNLDLKTRIPAAYREKEMEIRKLLSHKLKRGKVDFNLTVEDVIEQPKNKINTPVLLAYLKQLKELQPAADDTQLLVATLRLPDVLQTEKENIDEAEWQQILEILDTAVDRLMQYRFDEGQSLELDLKKQLNTIHDGLKEISQLDKNRLTRMKNRLNDALEQLKIEVDTNRFEQELIYYLEKLDINEEKVRLTNHLDYFLQELADNNILKGKKLGFITQEIGREINTIGSKANDSRIQREVVKMKDALEKIKEQVLNVL